MSSSTVAADGTPTRVRRVQMSAAGDGTSSARSAARQSRRPTPSAPQLRLRRLSKPDDRWSTSHRAAPTT
ncbi:MAG: hypothetical protein M9918_16940 [Anaerolineae bacterium]|nr:hypothetical protein [Anaerolineae bacterium]